jgi:glycosyltransferase involved in cell wall biosynthesis
MLLPHGVPALPVGSPGERKMQTAALRTRQAVGLDRVPLIATFGFLLPGKGLRQLLEAHHILCKSAASAFGAKPRLLMLNALYPAPVSEEERNTCQELIRKLGLTGQVTLMTDYLPEEQALTLLNMADLIVFPYQATQESSSAAVRMGLASRRPVAVTPLAIFDDVRHVTHQLPGITPPEMAAGIEELLKAAGHWRRRRWFAPKTPVKPSQITDQQAAWVDACAWSNLAHRFWGILRATAGSLSKEAPNA